MLAVTAIATVSVVLSFALGILIGLALLTWTLPIAGRFFAADLKLTLAWRAALLEDWIQSNLHINAAMAAMRALTNLPQGTVEAMLASLPQSADLTAELSQSPRTRRLIATLISEDSRDRVRQQNLKAMLALAVAVFISAAILLGDIRWLFGAAAGAIGFVVRWRVKSRISADALATLRSIAETPDCDRSAARQVLHEMVERGQISAHWLAAIGDDSLIPSGH